MLLAPLLASAAAGTPSPALSLRWTDPNGLAATSAQEFEARLSERLGHPAFNPAVTERTLSVNWQGSPDHCGVELLLVKDAQVEGTREIESPNGDCQALLPALLTVAALLVEAPSLEPEPRAAEPAPAPPPPPPRAPPGEPSVPGQAPVQVSVGGALSWGYAPRLELGPTAVLVWVPVASLRVGAEGALFIGHQYGKGPGFSLSHQRAGLLACAMPIHGRVAFGVCANAALHFFSAEGLSLPYPRTRDATIAGVGAGVRAEWRLASRWLWFGHAGADVVTRRLYFYYTPPAGGETTLFRQQRVMPTLLLGLSLELP